MSDFQNDLITVCEVAGLYFVKSDPQFKNDLLAHKVRINSAATFILTKHNSVILHGE